MIHSITQAFSYCFQVGMTATKNVSSTALAAIKSAGARTLPVRQFAASHPIALGALAVIAAITVAYVAKRYFFDSSSSQPPNETTAQSILSSYDATSRIWPAIPAELYPPNYKRVKMDQFVDSQ